MNATRTGSAGRGNRGFARASLLLLPALAWGMTCHLSPWITMWALSIGLFAALKLLTLEQAGSHAAPIHRIACYLLLWPGLNAPEFLHAGTANRETAKPVELVFALTKLAAGIVALVWAVRRVHEDSAMVTG